MAEDADPPLSDWWRFADQACDLRPSPRHKASAESSKPRTENALGHPAPDLGVGHNAEVVGRQMINPTAAYFVYFTVWMFVMMRRSVAFVGEPLVTAPS